jgi:hypothetical protein
LIEESCEVALEEWIVFKIMNSKVISYRSTSMKERIPRNLFNWGCGVSLLMATLAGCAQAPSTNPSPQVAPSQLPPPPPQASIRAVPNTAPAQPPSSSQPLTDTTPSASQTDATSAPQIAQATPSEGSHDRGQIAFQTGSTSTSVQGNLASKAIDRFTFTASAGQPATIAIESPNQDVLLTLVDPQGSPIQRYQSGSASWSGKLPTNGTYVVDVIATGSASTYKLNVSIQPLP